MKPFLRELSCDLFPITCTFPYSGWIAWNLFLAVIPLAFSFWLFRRQLHQKRSWVWWGVFLVYLSFLPNAPYLLTDIIHSVQAARSHYSVWAVVLVFIPLHFVAIVGGFEAYVISLINQEYYLVRQGAKRWVNLTELMTHALCALGIYLGRFDRLNSWDVVQDPTMVALRLINTLTTKWPVLVIFITFVIITVLYWIVKQITLGLVLRYREIRAQR